MSSPHVPDPLPPMGWYPDPTNPAVERYWEGTRWTHNTREPVAEPGWVSGLGSRPAERTGQARGSTASGVPGGPGGASGAGAGQASTPTARQWDHASMQWRELPVVDSVKRTADGVAVASWWRRLLGRVVDDLLIAGVVAMLCLPQYRAVFTALSEWWGPAYRDAQRGVAADTTALAEAISTHTALIGLVTVLTAAVWAVWFHHRSGSTPGQRLVGVRVVPLGQGRHEGGLPLPTAIRRAAALAMVLSLNQLVWVAWFLDGLWGALSPTGQTLHDRLGRTQVVPRLDRAARVPGADPMA